MSVSFDKNGDGSESLRYGKLSKEKEESRGDQMIDSVNNSSMGSLLRAQITSQSAGTTALKANKETTNTIISQLQEQLSQKGSSNAAPTFEMSSGTMPSNLPRGSLVNILV